MPTTLSPMSPKTIFHPRGLWMKEHHFPTNVGPRTTLLCNQSVFRPWRRLEGGRLSHTFCPSHALLDSTATVSAPTSLRGHLYPGRGLTNLWTKNKIKESPLPQRLPVSPSHWPSLFSSQTSLAPLAWLQNHLPVTHSMLQRSCFASDQQWQHW